MPTQIPDRLRALSPEDAMNETTPATARDESWKPSFLARQTASKLIMASHTYCRPSSKNVWCVQLKRP